MTHPDCFLYIYIQVYIDHRPLAYVLMCENVCQCPQSALVCLLFSLHATLELTPGWGRHLLLATLNYIPNVYFVVIAAPR